ncbi:MAG: M48 family metallopeptidase [Nitrospirae bacterium]|nr:M48 family metallopeptidase [Nitrospirota bacterium]
MNHTADSLAETLSAHAGRPVLLTVTRNLRSWVSVRRARGEIHARLHEALLAAPRPVLTALAGFVAKGGRTHAGVVRDYLRQAVADHPPRLPRLTPAGRHHHLGALLAEVMHHFPGHAAPAITWGQRRRPGRSRVRLGSYNPRQRLIRLHPLLDHPDVPPFMLRYVIHHEMAHHLLEHDRPRSEPMHGPRFAAVEAACPDLPAARRWQRDHLSAHLQRLRRAHA